MDKQKGLAPIAVVLLIAAAISGYLIYSGKIDLIQTNQPKKITEIYNEPTDFSKVIKYQSFDLGITAEYPASWALNELDPRVISFSGPEGQININKVDSFGGACIPEYEKIKIDEEDFAVCYSIKDNGAEAWEQITKEFKVPIGEIRGVVINAYTNSSSEAEKEVILKILSTFKFTN